MKKCVARILVILCLIIMFACKGVETTDVKADRHYVTDLMGRKVLVYNEPKRIAAITGLSLIHI